MHRVRAVHVRPQLDLRPLGQIGSRLTGRHQPQHLLRVARGVAVADRVATRAWPTLFGYQFLYRLERA